MAARNCVVRAPELRPKFLQLGLETIANEALQTHGLDEAKACLRDLGCDVALKEIWAGTGHKLEHASNTVLTEMNITTRSDGHIWTRTFDKSSSALSEQA